jgi:hypothetical protein
MLSLDQLKQVAFAEQLHQECQRCGLDFDSTLDWAIEHTIYSEQFQNRERWQQ